MSQPANTEGKGKKSGGTETDAGPARKNYVLRRDAALALSNDGPFLGGGESGKLGLGGDTQVKLEVVTAGISDSYIVFSVTVPIGAENEDTGFGVQF
jgi:hypothetical protein